jgi:signal recognition particle GTPase
VRKLIDEGKLNKEIQELLNLPRHTVTRIKNGTTVTRTESKVEKQTLTKEEQNIKKRKIFLDEILIVIDKTVKDEKPMSILEHLDAIRVKNNIKNELTIDIIKNLRRDICHGKVPFYKSEVSEEIYKRYEKLITDYNNKSL